MTVHRRGPLRFPASPAYPLLADGKDRQLLTFLKDPLGGEKHFAVLCLKICPKWKDADLLLGPTMFPCPDPGLLAWGQFTRLPVRGKSRVTAGAGGSVPAAQGLALPRRAERTLDLQQNKRAFTFLFLQV